MGQILYVDSSKLGRVQWLREECWMIPRIAEVTQVRVECSGILTFFPGAREKSCHGPSS